ncbi:MAG: hypothetical protein GY850_41175 [bacterium]|nr:hypothetical protein [bacterium]
MAHTHGTSGCRQRTAQFFTQKGRYSLHFALGKPNFGKVGTSMFLCDSFINQLKLIFTGNFSPLLEERLIAGRLMFNVLAISIVLIPSLRLAQKHSKDPARTVWGDLSQAMTSSGFIPIISATRSFTRSKSKTLAFNSYFCSNDSSADLRIFSTKSLSPKILLSPLRRIPALRNSL